MKYHLPLLLTAMTGAATAAGVFISEFEPNPVGADPDPVSFELMGTPLATFTGAVLSIESDSSTVGSVDRFSAVSGTFDGNGILVLSIPDLENPSFTVVLLEGTGADLTGVDLDTDDDGIADVTTFTGYNLCDALGVPDNTGDEAFLYGSQFGGVDFTYTGDEPKLVFRSGSNGDWFAINDPADDLVYSLDGTFSPMPDPSVEAPTFGAVNPTFDPVPEPSTALLGGLALLGLLRRRR